MKQCSRCWIPLDSNRKDQYCRECRNEYGRAYGPWKLEKRQGRVLPPYTGPKRGPKPVRNRHDSWKNRSIKVSEYVSIYDDDGFRSGQHELRMSPKKRHEILDAQGGRCVLCQTEICINGAGQGTKAELDHDHQPPYAVRGYLCSLCNRGIGMLQDDPDLLQVASDYVRRFREAGSQEETA